MMKICAFIWLTLKYILVILVDVKSNSFHIYNLLTSPPLKYRSGVFFCLRLSQKQVFDLGDRGINEWVPAAEPGNPSFSSAELNSACGVNSGKNSPNPSFRSRCFL